MPAVEMARLQAQIQAVIRLMDEPEAFHHALSALFDQYADRAYRPGQAIQPQPLLPSYRVTPLVTRQLGLELARAFQDRPQQALLALDALWSDLYLEPRLLAAQLLGSMGPAHDPVAADTLRRWGRPEVHFRVLEALFRQGTLGLRRSNPGLLLNVYSDWLNNPDPQVQMMGLRALAPLVEDPGFENLPPIFRLVSPFLQNPPPRLHADLAIVLEALSRRTPVETTYFLRQALSISTNPNTARLVRRCLPALNAEQQAGLKAAMQSAQEKR